jgi:hypothetical protein
MGRQEASLSKRTAAHHRCSRNFANGSLQPAFHNRPHPDKPWDGRNMRLAPPAVEAVSRRSRGAQGGRILCWQQRRWRRRLGFGLGGAGEVAARFARPRKFWWWLPRAATSLARLALSWPGLSSFVSFALAGHLEVAGGCMRGICGEGYGRKSTAGQVRRGESLTSNGTRRGLEFSPRATIIEVGGLSPYASLRELTLRKLFLGPHKVTRNRRRRRLPHECRRRFP